MITKDKVGVWLILQAIFCIRCSIAQIAGWFIRSIQGVYLPLLCSLKHSGALLGSNSMRNRIV